MSSYFAEALERQALQVLIDRLRGAPPLTHRFDDGRRAEDRVAACEHVRQCRLERIGIDLDGAPSAERQRGRFPGLRFGPVPIGVLADGRDDRVELAVARSRRHHRVPS